MKVDVCYHFLFHLLSISNKKKHFLRFVSGIVTFMFAALLPCSGSKVNEKQFHRILLTK